uniref:Uncharacterized protein n=1 Tax=Anguilla anguilla TaxID=7936 RepID=A0A0E9PFM5_ANGAN
MYVLIQTLHFKNACFVQKIKHSLPATQAH